MEKIDAPPLQAEDFKPFVKLPEATTGTLLGAAESLGVPGAAPLAKGVRAVTAPIKRMVEGMESPAGLVLAPAYVGAPELMLPLTSLQAAPQAFQSGKAAVKAVKEGKPLEALEAGSDALLNAALTAAPVLPMAARSARDYAETGKVGAPDLKAADLASRKSFDPSTATPQEPIAAVTMERDPSTGVMTPKARDLSEDEAQRLFLDKATADDNAALEETKPAPAEPEQAPQTAAPTAETVSEAKPPFQSAPTESPVGEPAKTTEAPPAISEPTTEEVKPQEVAPDEPTPEPTVKAEPKMEGPGMVDLGAATPSQFPEAQSAFKHWWDVHFGKPAAKILPTIKGLWQGRDVRAGMATMRDWVDNASKLFARANANDVRQPLQRQFGKDFSVADDALSFVVEAKGDPAALDEMRTKILDSKVADPWWRRKAYDALDFAIYHWDELNKLAGDYKGKTDAQIHIEQASGIDTLKREGYVPHRQDFSEEDFLFDIGKGDSTFFRKVREYPTFADSIAAGVDPVTLSASDLMENRLSAGMKLVNSRKWLDNLRAVTDPTTKLPIARNLIPKTRVDGTTYMEAPPGYVKESIGPHDVAIHKGYEGTFSALTDPSFFTKSMAGRAFMTANASGKSIRLMVDTFHLGRVAFWDSIIKATGLKTFKMPFPSYKRGVTLMDFSEAQIREMAANGEVPQKWLSTLLEDKRRLDMAVKSGYNVGRISDALYQDLIHNIPGLGTFNKWLFDKFQRGAMAESWLLEFERIKRASPGYSEAELSKQVSRDLNTRFGNLGRQGLLKSKSFQDIARVVALAPQWNEGLIRSELGAVKGIFQSAMDASTGKRIYTGVLLRSVGGMAVAQFVANQFINQITRGKFTWENPEEGSGAKLSAWIPDIAGNGPGFFLHPLGLAAETVHLLSNLYQRSGGDSGKMALDYARSRSSAAMGPILTFITRSDFLGRHIKPGTLWGEVVKSAIPTPIAGHAAAAITKQLATGTPSEQFPGQYQKQAMSSFGIRTEGAPSPEQRITRLAAAWRREHNVPVNVEITGGGEYSGLVSAVRMGNTTLARSEMEKLQANRTDKQILQYLKTWPKRAFTGSMAREREFRDGLSNEQEIAYLKARDERERIASEIRGMLR